MSDSPLIDKSDRFDTLAFFMPTLLVLLLVGAIGGMIWWMVETEPEREQEREEQHQIKVNRGVEHCITLCDECDAQFNPIGDAYGNVSCACICRGAQ